jgi:hypothetical protein
LDFLGFPWSSVDRIETYQWVTREKREKVFLGPFCPWRLSRQNGPTFLACGSAAFFMGTSPVRFLIVRKRLSRRAAAFGRVEEHVRRISRLALLASVGNDKTSGGFDLMARRLGEPKAVDGAACHP